MPVTTCIADFVGGVKAISSGWVNDNKLIRGAFRWQSGYGAVSHSKSQRDTVIKYIINQEEHHKIKTFKEEYLKMLNDFEHDSSVEYDENTCLNFMTESIQL